MRKVENPKTTPEDTPQKEWGVERMRASGPGGQHMQKTESKVRVRWYFEASKELSAEDIEKLKQVFPEGYIEATSQRSRFQQKNLEFAREKARERGMEILVPTPERIATGIPAAERERRIDEKKQTAKRKKFRGPVMYEE